MTFARYPGMRSQGVVGSMTRKSDDANIWMTNEQKCHKIICDSDISKGCDASQTLTTVGIMKRITRYAQKK